MARSIALHVIAALLLQDSIRRFLALLRALQSVKSQFPKVASTSSREPFQTSSPTTNGFNSDDKSMAATAKIMESGSWSETWAAGFVAAAWAAHPLRIEVCIFISSLVQAPALLVHRAHLPDLTCNFFCFAFLLHFIPRYHTGGGLVIVLAIWPCWLFCDC